MKSEKEKSKKISFRPLVRGVKRLIISVIKNDFFGMAAEMGFWMVIGIFPFMLFLMAVFGWMGNKSYMDPVLIFLSTIMPEQSMDLIITVLSEVTIFSQGKLMATIGIVVTLVLSTNALAVVLKGLNRAYKVEETRSFIYTRILSLMMVFVNNMVLFLTINLIVFGKVIINFLVRHLHMSQNLAVMLLTLRWPIAFLALYLMAFLCYYILPDLRGNDKFKRASALPGTFFFCSFWLLGSWGFSIYVNNLRTYNMVYGTIGAFAVLIAKAEEIRADFEKLKKPGT